MGEILRAEEPLLVLMADLLQQAGLLSLAEQPPAPPARRPQGTLHTLRRSGADRL
jgi:hypothetical protein